MSMIGFPLLLIPLAIYNIVVFLMQGVGFDAPLARIALVSGRVWTPTFSDALLALGMLLLILEMMKAARPGAKHFTDHLLSFLVFAGAAAEFAMLPQFATSTFFLLTMLALVDFVASVGVRSRREQSVEMRRGKKGRSEEPSFQPSAASDLATPTEPEIKAAPAVTPQPAAIVEPIPVPEKTLSAEGTPARLSPEHPEPETKPGLAAINPQR